MTFYEFVVKNYDGKNEPAGDLAEDMQDDKNFPKQATDWDKIESYLYSKGAITDAISTAKKVYAEYTKANNM